VESIQKSHSYFSQSTSSWIKLFQNANKEKHSPAAVINDNPLVSVVLVHHNRHILLQEAIASLEKQTYKHFEIVLVDDGSTDPEAIAFLNNLAWTWWEKKGWRVIREPNRYLGAARNTGGEK
jgi:cellulose synthase/poly-beta-1,6-N-acetylglucosamine synthase-like glycosyltransferase